MTEKFVPLTPELQRYLVEHSGFREPFVERVEAAADLTKAPLMQIAGDQAALHLGQAQIGRLDGDGEVAGEQQLGAAAEGVAVDRGDRRLGREVVDEPREAEALAPRGQDQLAARNGRSNAAHGEG